MTTDIDHADDPIAVARANVAQPGAPGFEGEIGASMAEFSADYMSYIEQYLDDDLRLVPDRVLAPAAARWPISTRALR